MPPKIYWAKLTNIDATIQKKKSIGLAEFFANSAARNQPTYLFNYATRVFR